MKRGVETRDRKLKINRNFKQGVTKRKLWQSQINGISYLVRRNNA